jgi:predicted Abi (CAAX) family protease
MGTRPIVDTLVFLPTLSHTYTLGDLTFSPLTELDRQLTVMMARYRTGDGTGASTVTPAQSCVQDSSQALYETIRVLRNQVSRSPSATGWLANHPNDPQTALFRDLVALGQRLQGQLVPLGMVRPDWRDNASVLTGIEEAATVDTEAAGRFANQTTWLNNLLSWRTVIPRVAYDNMAAIFLQQGADLWFLGTAVWRFRRHSRRLFQADRIPGDALYRGGADRAPRARDLWAATIPPDQSVYPQTSAVFPRGYSGPV